MKIRENLNKKVFNETTINGLLDNLDLLYNQIECFVNKEVEGGEITGLLLKPTLENILNNPIIKTLNIPI